MSDLLARFLDPYERPARLYPGLLAIAPLVVLLVAIYGKADALVLAASVAGGCGIAYALGRVARDAGKRIQDRLYKKWGGPPTTQILRHRDTTLDIHTKQRFHKILSKGLGIDFPNAKSEAADPVAADEVYRAATTWLIGQTRDAKLFPLVLKENIAYGFQRNSLGLRPLGVFICTACICWVLLQAGALAIAAPYFNSSALGMKVDAIAALVASAVMLLMWTCALTEGALRRTAFGYAERLVQSCDRLSPQSSEQKSSGVATQAKAGNGTKQRKASK